MDTTYRTSVIIDGEQKTLSMNDLPAPSDVNAVVYIEKSEDLENNTVDFSISGVSIDLESDENVSIVVE